MSQPKRRLEWRKTAERNLADIETWYLENASAQISDAAVDAIYYQAEKILTRPMLYRQTDRSNVRESVMNRFPYLIRYRVTINSVTILRILHQRQAR